MPVQNSRPLTRHAVDLMNTGIRLYSPNAGDKNALAEFFGVGVRTVQYWFTAVPDGGKRCVPLAVLTWPNDDPPPPTIPLAPFDMFDADNGSGIGDGSNANWPLQNARLRTYMCAALGVDGGFARQPIFNGTRREIVEKKGTIAECVGRMNAIICNAATNFLFLAWVSFTIEEEPGQGWELTIVYHEIGADDDSDFQTEPKAPNDPNDPTYKDPSGDDGGGIIV